MLPLFSYFVTGAATLNPGPGAGSQYYASAASVENGGKVSCVYKIHGNIFAILSRYEDWFSVTANSVCGQDVKASF